MKKTLVLFQQDLRLRDNPALTHAAARGEVVPVYIWDDEAAGEFALGGASRWWLHHSLTSLGAELDAHGIRLILRRGNTAEIVCDLLRESGADAVYWNRCYEPYNIAKYKALKAQLEEARIEARSFNASLLFEPWKILNQQGEYFKVFTPYWNHCLKQGGIEAPYELPAFSPSTQSVHSDTLDAWRLLPHAPDWSGGLRATWKPGEGGAQKNIAQFLEQRLNAYPHKRDFPAQNMTSHLSASLHFGEIGPRQIWHSVKAHEMRAGNTLAVQKFLSEVGWREFSYYLLYHFPALPHAPFRTEFARFPWVENSLSLRAWQRGKTGYPIVDAGMRELWHTGYMHNRVRMIAASFLTKDLRIPWQKGAAWFWDTLVDADLASNSASWQWVAGSGADASPYFRIFNPVLQGKKFDEAGEYIRRWVPEISGLAGSVIHCPWEASDAELAAAGITLGKTYPLPMVDHAQARNVALSAYKTLRTGLNDETV